MDGKKPSSKRYPPELKERAVRMVQELRREDPGDNGVISRVARQLGIGVESLRIWVKQADVDAGDRSGLTTSERAELVELRKKNRDLQRSNDMADSTGQRNESCEISESRSREDEGRIRAVVATPR